MPKNVKYSFSMDLARLVKKPGGVMLPFVSILNMLSFFILKPVHIPQQVQYPQLVEPPKIQSFSLYKKKKNWIKPSISHGQ